MDTNKITTINKLQTFKNESPRRYPAISRQNMDQKTRNLK